MTADAAMPDAAKTSDAPIQSAGLCANPQLDEHFTSAMPCNGWGTRFSSHSSVTEGAGHLSITLQQTSSDGGCDSTSSYAIGPVGVIVEVPAVINVMDGYTALQFQGIDRSLGFNNHELLFATLNSQTVFASMPFDTATMRFWRMRASGSGIVAEYSADAMTWLPLGAQATTLAGPIKIALIAGTNDVSSGDTAQFARFVVCAGS